MHDFDVHPGRDRGAGLLDGIEQQLAPAVVQGDNPNGDVGAVSLDRPGQPDRRLHIERIEARHHPFPLREIRDRLGRLPEQIGNAGVVGLFGHFWGDRKTANGTDGEWILVECPDQSLQVLDRIARRDTDRLQTQLPPQDTSPRCSPRRSTQRDHRSGRDRRRYRPTSSQFDRRPIGASRQRQQSDHEEPCITHSTSVTAPEPRVHRSSPIRVPVGPSSTISSRAVG